MAGKPRSHMGLGQSLVQKQTQRLIITQDLRQSIELLPMSNLELSDRIQKEMLENPLLEDVSDAESFAPAVESVPEERPGRTAAQTQEGGGADESGDARARERPDPQESWRDRLRDRSLEGMQGGAERTERKHQFLQNAVQSTETLADHLLWQLRMSTVTKQELAAGEVLISAIDQKGFLTQSLEDLFHDSGLSINDAVRALRIIQGLDPVGCGAANVPETLLIQAKVHYPYNEVLHELLQIHFEDIEKLDYKKIEKSTGYTEARIQDCVQLIRNLEPYPGTLFSSKPPEYVVPDVITEEIDGDIEVIINDDWMPNLKLNEEYRQLLKQRSDEERQYMQEKTNSAVWLMKSLRQRRITLFRVMKCIVQFQEEFFRKGPGHLRPLTLREVAEKVELHESTISRVTTNKYVQTKWGLFELKYFFSSSLSGSSGEKHSARSIQGRIRNLVDGEDAENPLSDQEIVELFKKEGVQIARRTVAKYRKVLRILPGDRRKKLKRLHPAKSQDL